MPLTTPNVSMGKVIEMRRSPAAYKVICSICGHQRGQMYRMKKRIQGKLIKMNKYVCRLHKKEAIIGK